MARQPEIRSLQALRAGACLSVVVYHGLSIGAPRLSLAWPNASAGVDVFFVISGFVMMSSVPAHPSRGDWRTFLLRRVVRIVPLYWFMTGLKLAVVALNARSAPNTHPNAWNVAASLAFIPSRDATGALRPVLPVGWTLNFEMLFYGLFALALAARLRPFPALLVPLSALAFASFWREAAWPAPLAFANGLVLEFAFGMAIAHARAQGWTCARPGTLILLGLAGLALLPLAGNLRCLMWGGPAVALVAGLLARETTWGPRIPNWIVASGEASYATYLSHTFLSPMLSPFGIAAPLAAVPMSLGLGWVVHTNIDRPLRRIVSGTRYVSGVLHIQARS